MSKRNLRGTNRDLTRVPVPVVGMLSGNSISAIVVSIDYVLKEFVCVSGVITTVTPSAGY